MKTVFFKQPTYTLSQYMAVQIQISLVKETELLRRTPEIVDSILSHLEALIESNHISKKKILLSFYALENEAFGTSWDVHCENTLKTAKDDINIGKFQASRFVDSRVLVQILLDFLESLKEPAISRTTVAHLGTQVNSGISSQEILHEQLEAPHPTPRDPSKKINKFELVLLSRIKIFLQKMLPIKPSEEEYLNKAVIRILISLLNAKPEHKGHFFGRSMTEFKFSPSMPLLKDLNGVLAYWLTEEHTMNKHVQVKPFHSDLR